MFEEGLFLCLFSLFLVLMVCSFVSFSEGCQSLSSVSDVPLFSEQGEVSLLCAERGQACWTSVGRQQAGEAMRELVSLTLCSGQWPVCAEFVQLTRMQAG